MDRLKQACAYLEIKKEQVLSHKVYEDARQIVLVYDRGVLGCPKVIIPFDVLDKEDDPAEVEAKKVDALKKKVVKPQEKPKPKPRKRSPRKKAGA